MCGGVRHYNPRPRTAPCCRRFGTVYAEFDAWGSLMVKDTAKGVQISPADLVHYGEDGRKLSEWIRQRSEVFSSEFPE